VTTEAKLVESYRNVIKFLDNTTKNVGMYPAEHPSVAAPAGMMFEALGEVYSHSDEVLIGVINSVLYINDYLFYDSTPSSRHILEKLEKFGIDDLVVRKGVTQVEMLELAGILNARGSTREEFIKLLEEKKLDYVGLKSFTLGDDEDGDLPVKGLQLYHDAVSTMTDLFSRVKSGKMPPFGETEEVVDGFVDKLSSNRSLLKLLSSLKSYDAYTYQHCVNVGILALLLGEAEGLEDQNLRWAGVAGMMHDVGKVKIIPEILNKPGGLTLREWETMKTHPSFSAEIVQGMGGSGEVVMAVGGHHMNFDGSGYPVRSDGLGPSNLASLVSVVDAYDAITTIRSYKKPMDPVEALEFLRNGRGSKFNPLHVDTMLKVVGEYPPGTLVRLTSNEVVVVVESGESAGNPVVRMIVDEEGILVDERVDLDLAGEGAQGRAVASVVDPVLYGFDPAQVLA